MVWQVHGWSGDGGKISNIGREDSVAILRALGDGDALRAAGREVLVTAYSRLPGQESFPFLRAHEHLCRIDVVWVARNGRGYNAYVSVLEPVTLEDCECMAKSGWARAAAILGLPGAGLLVLAVLRAHATATHHASERRLPHATSLPRCQAV